MDRVNGARTIDIGGGRRGFRSQNLAAGLDGTEVTAVWLNDLQENFCRALEAHGFVLAPGDWTLFEKVLRFAATTEVAGRVELATFPETRAGVDNVRAVTPAGLASAKSELRAPVTRVWATAGTYTFTVPADVTRVYIDVTGGGGGGGGQKGDGLAAGGGGAGQAEGAKVVTPGQNITITVGVGGAGGTGSTTAANPTNGGAGGTSSVGSLMSATGGGGGQASASGVNPGSGGQGVGSGGDINRAGSGGGTGFASIGGQGGGTYRVSGSPLNSGGQGQPGYGPGGGGSGASGGGSNGGAGAPGQVIITY